MNFKECLFVVKCCLAKPSWWRLYREALSHDRMSSDELADYNWHKRLDILRYAYENSPYYRKLYGDAGLEPGDVKSEADWNHVPMLTREALRENFELIRVTNWNKLKCRMYTTGGSTGEPSKVLKDDRFSSQSLNWRAATWAGDLLGQNSATIMRTHPVNLKGALRHLLATLPARSIMLDAGNMTEETLSTFVAEWRANRPYVVSSYVGGVHELAVYCMEHHIELPPPKRIVTTAAPLEDVVRHTISRAFHAPVYDSYVATEAHPMANQCSALVDEGSRALHIHNDYRYLEFVDDDGMPMPDEQVGDILVTDLEDRVFPIVRYRLGDRGRLLNRKCSCGRPYPLMDAVHGRSFDFIYLEKGRIMGECWATAFDDCLGAVQNFQIHQAQDKSVALRVVENKNYPNSRRCIEAVANNLRSQLGNIPLTVEYCDVIPHNRGKIKYIISDIKD